MSLIDRLGGLAGIGAATYFLFLPVPTQEVEVGLGEPSAQVAEALAANAESERLGSYLGLIAVFLLVMFFARWYGALRDAAPRSWLPVMTLAGGVLLAGVLLVEIGMTFAGAEIGRLGEETEVVNFFALWGYQSANLFAPPFAIALASSTMAVFSAAGSPTWYRWASAGLLVLLLLIVGVLRAPGLAIAPGTLWMFLTSIVLTRGTIGEVAT